MATISEMHIVVVADISGSMSSMGDTPRIKLNEFIKEQHGKDKHAEVSIDCWTFSDTHKLLFENKSVAEAHIPELTPTGGTALYASLGYIIDKTGQKLANMPEASRPQRVIVVIYTDGEENSSEEFDVAGIKSLIEELRSQGWTFAFIGANQEVEKVAFSISIKNSLHFEADAKSMKHMFVKENMARERYNMSVSQNSRDRDGLYDDEEKK